MTMVYDYIAGVKTAAEKSYIEATGDVNTQWLIYSGRTGDTAAISRNKFPPSFNLHLPNMPMDGRLTRKEVERLTGFWLHEVLGHAVQTDFNVWDQAVSLNLSKELNVIEDVRIERGIIENPHYPNAKHYLETLVESIAYKAARDGFDWNKPQALLSCIAYIGRVELLGYDAPSIPQLSSLNKPMQNTLSRIFAAIKTCAYGKPGTLDAFEIAKSLKQASQQTRQQQQQQQQQQNGQSGDKAQGDDTQGASAGNGDGNEQGDKAQGNDAQSAAGNGEQGDDMQGASAGNDDKAQNKQNDTGGNAGEQGTKATDNGQDFDAPLDTKPNDISDRFNKTGTPDQVPGYMQRAATVISSWVGETERKFKTPSDSTRQYMQTYGQDYAGLKNRLTGSAKLRIDIKNFVSAPERVSFERYLESGRLDTRLAAKMRAGSTRVFKRRLEDEGQNAAVMFLMDCSPSMSGTRAIAATTLAIHMTEAVESAGAPVCVAAFWDRTNGAEAQLRIAKPFNKRARACAWALANMSETHSQGTNMSPAILQAAKKLKTVNATRRILFVLTDGQCNWNQTVTYECAKLAENMGVEVIGFGVGCDVTQAFPNAINVPTDMTLIARTGLKALADKLKTKRAA